MKRPHPHLSLNQPSLKAKCASFAASRYAQALVFVRVAEKRFTKPDVVGIQPDGEAPAEPPAHEEAAPLAFPLSGMAEAMEEPQVEFDEVAIT